MDFIKTVLNNRSIFLHFRFKKFSYHFYIGCRGIFGFFAEGLK